MVPPLEAVADAMMHREGWAPGSHSYRNRNPGNLRPSSPMQPRDEQNYRVFNSLGAGYTALLSELTAKFTGANEHGIGPSSTLQELIDVYAPRADKNDPSSYALDVAHWCTIVLGRTITVASKLVEIWPGATMHEAPPAGTF